MINKISLTNLKPFAKIGLIVLGLMIVVILITIIAASLNQSKTKYTPPTPLPSIQPKKITQPAQFQDEFSKIKPLLPYTGQGYKIEFLAPVNAINITITANSAEEFLSIKKNAENYIKQKGVNNICSLNIFWVPPSNLPIKTIRATDLITAGCPVVPK